ncbi:16S rRNA (cytosine967-C5)-methyltransferase [Fusobacterium naviforme]|nr:16S rRNA (cytosine(967)-C(5))-methyltransferase RsmB [Fusobacterium naviforme]PSL09463.1 16S rRNA (cytosine967-C5)-methyltransferase [Fusobacterium naviforme]STO27072.1 Ribosomal RNA small subunit methyltransferase B [Fusobacterium naviforme]
MTEVSARSVALDCLMAVTEEGQFSHTVLNGAREKYAWMAPEDRAFFGRLVHGSLERLIQLDWALDHCSSVKTKKMKPVIRNILRLSVYQLLFLDRVPAHAVTNEAVRLTEKRGLRGLKGFVNAVLRRIAQERESLLAALSGHAELGLRRACPAWIAARLEGQYGSALAEQILTAFLAPRGLSVHVNRTALEKDGVQFPEKGREKLWKRSACCPDIYSTEAAEGAAALSYIESGVVFVQDLSSALAVMAAAPAAGERVIDLCAAPGGKSLAAADFMRGAGEIRSFDISERKLALVRENAARCGFAGIIHPELWDAEALKPELVGEADLVIADLPCSGLGVLGGKPDIKLRLKEESIAELAALQRRFLKNAVAYVKPGGRLLFSTCTITEEENQENRRWLLAEYPELGSVDLRDRLAALKGIPGADTLAEGWMQLLPGALPCDGFFFSVFQKAR